MSNSLTINGYQPKSANRNNTTSAQKMVISNKNGVSQNTYRTKQNFSGNPATVNFGIGPITAGLIVTAAIIAWWLKDN